MSKPPVHQGASTWWPHINASGWRPRLLVRGAVLSLAALSLLAGGAEAVGSHTYRGQTSQGQPIFFTVYSRGVHDLYFKITDSCPRHRTLIVTDQDIPTMQIKHRRFSGQFVAKSSKATLKISGHFARRTAIGVLTDHTRSKKTHRLCKGRARFRLRPI